MHAHLRHALRSTMIADNGALPDQLQLLALHPSVPVYRPTNPQAPATHARRTAQP